MNIIDTVSFQEGAFHDHLSGHLEKTMPQPTKPKKPTRPRPKP